MSQWVVDKDNLHWLPFLVVGCESWK